MTEELWKNSAIIAKRNVDSNQTPISVNLTELKQIIDVHSCLVLNQLPDEHYGIDIDGFTEVYDIEDVTTRSYKVDYANGVLYFHPNNIGKMLQVNYYGVGCTLLSASRIYTKYDKYGNVLETLEELLDKGKLYIQAIDALGGAVEVINRVENANATGTVLHENLLEDIEIGSKLNKDLIDNNHIAENTITTLMQKNEIANQTINNLIDKTNLANQKKQELEVTTSNANNKNTELNNTISTANNTDTKLRDTILSGKDSIDKINATGNKSLIIGASQFVNNEYTWTHNMNSKELNVVMYDSILDELLLPDCKIIDKNNILIRNSAEHPNIKVVLSASYYQGNALFGTNVEEFASDSIEVNAKKVRLKDGNGIVENPITDSDSVFMTDGTTKLTNYLNNMVIDYESNLLGKINEVNTKITDVNNKEFKRIVLPSEDLISIMENSTRPLYLLKGTYVINKPLKFINSFEGESLQDVKIKPSDNFVGSCLVDFDNTTERKYIKNITFDINYKDISAFSSTVDGSGSSSSVFENLWFIQGGTEYVINANSTTTNSGMLTGSTFLNCHFNGNSAWCNFGNNQDDITMINCRFGMDGTVSNKNMLCIYGTNINFNGCYFNITNTNSDISGIKALVVVGSNIVSFKNCFFESMSNVNLTHIVFCSNPTCNVSMESIHFNITSTSMKSIFRYGISDASDQVASIRLDNITGKPNFPNLSLVDLFNGSNASNSIIKIQFSNVDILSSIVSKATGSYDINGKYETFGIFKGENLSNSSKSTTITTQISNINTVTEKISSNGVYLLTVCSKITNDINHSIFGTFLLTFVNQVYKIANVQQIGTSIKTNTTIPISSINVSLNDLGVISVTTNYTGNYAIGVDTKIVKLMSV